MNSEHKKQGYLLEDFRLFHLRSPQGVKTEYHYHEFCKILLLLSGTGDYWVDGQHYALQPGDMVFVGNGCVHRPDFAPGSPYERIIIYISPEFLQQQSSADCDLLDCFSGEHGHVLRYENGRQPLLTIIQELEKELSGDALGRVILSQCLLTRLMVEVLRSFRHGNSLQPVPSSPKSNRILAITKYIDAHLSEDLSIDALAEEFFLSKYHMMRLFRESTGYSIYTYIIQRRLLLARDLISQGYSATESCFRSGFGSYSSFTRTYGKYFGTTPTGRKYAQFLPEDTDE